ncbi:hypothetical protein Taro_000390, partial [Colocasia esculenta]|nr:hypothetical protein [Colocasia esculenta]
PSIIIDRISNNKRNCSYLWSILSAEHLKNYDCWDCLWFPYYKSNASQRKKMLTWVKDKEVFLKKYSFVSICMGHWSLVILCHEEEDDLSFIMLLDSLHSIDPTKLVQPIQRFLKDIYATKNKTEIVDAMSSIDISIPSNRNHISVIEIEIGICVFGSKPDPFAALVPQQTNGTECGFFVLYYIYHFIKNDPPSFSLDDYPSFLTCDWFSRAEFENFVDDLILRKIEVQEVVVEVSKKKHRGPTKLSSVHGLDNGKRIVIQINELRQPVGEGGHSLKLFLGTIARLGDKMSIDAPTWRAMSATHKDDVWKYSDINKRSKSHHKYFHCAGTKSFADINEEESKQVKSTPNMERCVQSSASVIEPKGKQSLMLGKKVKLCDMEGHQVANVIIMSLDKSKMVMGKSLGEEYYEVESDDT